LAASEREKCGNFQRRFICEKRAITLTLLSAAPRGVLLLLLLLLLVDGRAGWWNSGMRLSRAHKLIFGGKGGASAKNVSLFSPVQLTTTTTLFDPERKTQFSSTPSPPPPSSSSAIPPIDLPFLSLVSYPMRGKNERRLGSPFPKIFSGLKGSSRGRGEKTHLNF